MLGVPEWWPIICPVTKRLKATTAGSEQILPTWVAVVGWVLTVAGAVTFGVLVGRPWVATVGSGFDYVVKPPPVTTPNWAAAIAIFGPLLGFNLVYFGSAKRYRRRAMLVFAWLLGAQLLALVASAVWLVGAGRPASGITGSGDSPLGPLIFILLCCGSAGAIMAWLGGNSTFDRQRGEYFTNRQATVEVTPTGPRGRVAWVLGTLLLVVVFVVVPSRLAVDHLDDRYTSAPQRAWPQPWESDSSFATAIGLLALVCGLLLGLCVSMSIKTLLYRTVLSAQAARSSRRNPRSFGLRTLRFVHHWPIAFAGMWWVYWLSWGIAERDAGAIDDGIGVPLLLGLLPFALGLLLISGVWRAQDQTGAPRPMRLRQGQLSGPM